MTVRQVSEPTQSFKVAPVAKIQHALVGENIAGEKSPIASHGPKWCTPQAPTTQDLDTLCVGGAGLKVCPILQSDSSVMGWTGCDASELVGSCDSQQPDPQPMSTTQKAESDRELIKALDRQSANICRRCDAILPASSEIDTPGDDRRECPRCRLIQEVPAA